MRGSGSSSELGRAGCPACLCQALHAHGTRKVSTDKKVDNVFSVLPLPGLCCRLTAANEAGQQEQLAAAELAVQLLDFRDCICIASQVYLSTVSETQRAE